MNATPINATGPAAMPARSSDFNPAINGFRGVCVLLVFAYHVTNSGLLPDADTHSALQDAVKFFTSSWRYGVELFFMISGYVIVASLRRHGSVGAFLRDRFLRIFPVWIPVCVAVFAIGVAIGWKILGDVSAPQKALVFGANLLLLPPLVPIPVLHPASWSLSYEWVFYLLAAAAFALYAMRGSSHWRALSWVVWASAALGFLWALPRAVFFLPGVVLALGWLPLTKYRSLLRWPLLSLLVLLLAWRAVDLDQAHPAAYSVVDIMTSVQSLFVLVALLAGLHLFACICAGTHSSHLATHGAARWLCRSEVQFLGTISYSFYLWHPIVMFAVKRPIALLVAPHAGAVAATAVFALVSFAVGLLCSWVSYRLFERGVAGALRRRFERRKPVAIALPATDAQSATLSLRIEGR